MFFLQPGSDSGTTAVVALIRGKQLIVANAGDSRCVVSEGGKAVDMSYDHKPEDEVELARIKNAGGKVTMDGRVNGGLNLSRAIGEQNWGWTVVCLASAHPCFQHLPATKFKEQVFNLMMFRICLVFHLVGFQPN